MRSDWEADLRTLELVQADLKRRLEGLDKQIAYLRAELTAEQTLPPAEKVVPPAKNIAEPIEGLPAVVQPPPVPVVSEPPPVRPPPFPMDMASLQSPSAAEKEISSRAAGPPPIPQEPANRTEKTEDNLEMKVGQYWLVRIGILVLLTGLVLLGNLAYQNVIAKLGAGGKVALLYLAGAALTAVGCWLERKMEKVRNYAQVLMAGGAATIYYTTYAAHFVPRLRIIESPLVGGTALLLLAGGLAWFATRRKIEGVAFTAVLLSYYTSAINSAANFTLFSNIVLTGVAVFLLARHRWFGVSWLSLVGSYTSFAYWRLQGEAPQEDFWFSHGFLAAYWIIFTVAVFLHGGTAFGKLYREAFLTANNALFFALFSPAFHARYPDQFWLFALIFSGILMGLSLLARRVRRDDLAFDGAYLAQGLIVLAIALVTKFSGYQLGIILTVESTALLYLSRFRHSLLKRVASGLTAAGGAVFSLEAFADGHDQAWVSVLFVGALLIANAALLKHLLGALKQIKWTWGAAGYGWAGMVLIALVIGEQLTGNAKIWLFLGAAVAVTVSLAAHRMPEIALGGQGYLLLSLMLLGGAAVEKQIGWANALPGLLCAVGLMHWWQHTKTFAQAQARTVEAIDAFVVCLVLLLWFSPDWLAEGEMLRLALAGLGLLGYGMLTRAWFLAAYSQLYTLGGAALCFYALGWGHASPVLTLGTIAVVAGPAALSRLIPGKENVSLREIFVIYRAIVLVLVLAWVRANVAQGLQFLVLALAGALVFIPAALRKNGEYLLHAVVLVGAGAICYVCGFALGGNGSGSDFVALLIVLALHQAGKKWLAGTTWFPAEAQAILGVVTLGAIWYQASQWVWDSSSGLAVTVVWALLAFAALGAGFLLRERSYRLMGMLILAVAVGHVFFVDVWKMGQVAGILGIICLALVLLGLGFIYNRYAEQIRKWL